MQIPTWDARCIDLQKAAESKTYADEKGLVNECGLEITELSTHLQGQLVAVHPHTMPSSMASLAAVHGKQRPDRSGQCNN